MVDLEGLAEEYLKAKAEFRDNPSDQNYENFKSAKQAFSEARTAVRREEEAAGYRESNVETVQGAISVNGEGE